MLKTLSFYKEQKIEHKRLFELQILVSSFENVPPYKINKKLAQVCLNNKDGEMSPSLEPLVGLLMLARESRLSNLMSTFDDFKKLFDISSLQINNFLQQSFIETEMTSSIKNILWNSNHKFILVGANTTQLSQETIIKKI